jgi:hypothetical protein
MPNWCYNYAEIRCPNKDVYNKLLDSIKNKCWFTTFAPLNVGIESDNSSKDRNMDKNLIKISFDIKSAILNLQGCKKKSNKISLYIF